MKYKILVLRADLVAKAKSDDDLRYNLAKANDVKINTIDRWLRENDGMLTTATNLEIISHHFGIEDKALLTEQLVPA